MLTISQLAAHVGVTVRSVRHYHQIGLLPEPERDRSGYRSYDAAAVVRLIKIRTLADAGVPLAHVQTLLDASPEAFAHEVQQIDKELRAEIRRLQGNRQRLARLAAGEHLALPQSVVDYLDRLRASASMSATSSWSGTAGSWSLPGCRTRSTPSSPRSTRSSTTPTWSSSIASSAQRSTGRSTTRGSSRSPTSWSA